MTVEISRVFGDQTLEEAFPDVKSGIEPFGERVVVQLKLPPLKTKSGLLLADYTRETDQDTCQIAKVVELGPLAYCYRRDGSPWPEGSWAPLGTYVRVPKYIGDRWAIRLDENRTVVFALFKDVDLLGKVSDPLTIRSFV